jgi:signal peptidase I
MALDSETKKASEGGWRDIVTIFVHALIIAFVVRVFLYQPFNIPSGSMQSTLLIGDYLFVSKLSYGYSRYSFPFGLNLFSGRILDAEPKRGDVVVFKLPRDNSTDYIKRVIGLPGDEISVRRGILFINGREVQRPRRQAER